MTNYGDTNYGDSALYSGARVTACLALRRQIAGPTRAGIEQTRARLRGGSRPSLYSSSVQRPVHALDRFACPPVAARARDPGERDRIEAGIGVATAGVSTANGHNEPCRSS